jgi:CheY-like chemotaxis protein
MENKTKGKVSRLMVIDDGAVDLYVMLRLAVMCNFCVSPTGYRTAQEALSFLYANQEMTDKLPEVIFVDIEMPGMDGFDFLAAYEKFPEVTKSCSRIFVTSATIDLDKRRRAMGNRYVRGFYDKPLLKENFASI